MMKYDRKALGARVVREKIAVDYYLNGQSFGELRYGDEECGPDVIVRVSRDDVHFVQVEPVTGLGDMFLDLLREG